MDDQQLYIMNALMKEDVEANLQLTNVIFTGECVITENDLTFYKTEITDEFDQTISVWIARIGDDNFLLEDDQPEGIHIPAKTV